MDETKGQGDESSTESSSQTSVAAELTSGIEESKQYSGAETKKLVEDALSKDGRAQKTRADAAEITNKLLTSEVETAKGNITTLTANMEALTKAQNEAAAEKVKDDPAALGSLRVQQANAAETIRLATQKATQEATQKTIDASAVEAVKVTINADIKLAALAAGIDEAKLKELVPDGNKERLVTAATLLKGQTVIDPKTGKTIPAALTQKPLPGQSAGGDFTGLDADAKIARGLEIKKKT